MPIENYRKTMSCDVLHSWAVDAQAELEQLRAQLHSQGGEAVAYLDIGAGGYVDLGTDQPIEALEKLPYGRHMLGIVGTYGADGWKPTTSQSVSKLEPVGYAAFSDNGKIRVWSLEPGVIEMMAAQGCKAVPLYTHPADQEGVTRELLDLMAEVRRRCPLPDWARIRIDALLAKSEGVM